MPTLREIEEKEDTYYMQFLNEATRYASNEKNVDGVKFKNMVAAAGVVAKQRQTRGAMRALDYQIARDTNRGLIARHETKILPNTKAA